MKKSYRVARNLIIIFNVTLVIMFFVSIPKWFMEGNPVSKYIIGKKSLVDKGNLGNPIFEAIHTINNQTVIVKYTIINGAIRISDAWVKTR